VSSNVHQDRYRLGNGIWSFKTGGVLSFTALTSSATAAAGSGAASAGKRYLNNVLVASLDFANPGVDTTGLSLAGRAAARRRKA
jgi:hypothetical protein